MLYNLINLVFDFLYICLIVRVVLSWIPHNSQHSLIRIVYAVSDPLIRPFQMLIPPMRIGIDISPIIALLALSFVRRIILRLLF